MKRQKRGKCKLWRSFTNIFRRRRSTDEAPQPLVTLFCIYSSCYLLHVDESLIIYKKAITFLSEIVVVMIEDVGILYDQVSPLKVRMVNPLKGKNGDDLDRGNKGRNCNVFGRRGKDFI